ncbi:MAG: AAA family ATPase [Pseudomonadota bacterium]|nr:AAA family ATPase [Pseudomonadota bacterium]
MTPLITSIRLSNVRSFGSEVKLDLSSGVTVLCAPNGSGKTSLFEGFELALTNGVRRLPDHFPAFVKDGRERATVSINWTGRGVDEVGTKTVGVSKAGELVSTGGLSGLLGDIDASALPYLLPLTHLLVQSPSDWMVRTDPKKAGPTLDRLPTGRDASKARTVLANAKKASTQFKDRAVEEAKTAEEALKTWRDATSRRDARRALLPSQLPSKAELAVVLRGISTRPWAKPHAQEVSAETLESSVAWLMLALSEHRDELVRRSTELTSLVPLVDALVDLERALEAAGAAVAEVEARRAAAHGAVQLARTESENALAVEQNLRKALARAQESERRRNVRGELAARLQTLIEALSTAEHARESARVRHEEAATAVHAVDLSVAWYEARRARRSAVSLDEDLLTASTTALGRWREAEAASDAEAAVLAALVPSIDAAASGERGARATLLGIRDRVDALKRTADDLAVISGAVQAAVATIESHLPRTEGTCPVCLVPHGPEELQSRMKDAKSRLDPRLREASEALRLAQADYTAAARDYSKSTEAVAELERQGSAARVRLHALHEEAREARQFGRLSGSQDLDEAMRMLNAERERLDEEVLGLSDAGPREYTSSEQADARSSEQVARQAKDDALTDHLRIAGETERARTAFETAPGPDDGDLDVPSAEGELAKASTARIGKAQALTQAEEHAAATETEHQRAAARRTEAQASRDRVVARWAAAGLGGSPSDASLQAERSLGQEAAALTSEDSAVLGEVQIASVRWREAALFTAAQVEVDRLRGGVEEGAHDAVLVARRDAAKTEAARRTKVRGLMDEVDDALKERLEGIRELVVAPLNPIRQALLRRIVRDARFAGTQLEFTAPRGGAPQASTSVSLHGARVPAQLVGSEAQLADVELTFLLAMALKHPWAPWRGLLLDDPTQHHDVVHAAGVFDVLRDYVAEHGFQVVFATHDTLQADFFVRKLRNDGIEHSVWRLQPGADGMDARQNE